MGKKVSASAGGSVEASMNRVPPQQALALAHTYRRPPRARMCSAADADVFTRTAGADISPTSSCLLGVSAPGATVTASVPQHVDAPRSLGFRPIDGNHGPHR